MGIAPIKLNTGLEMEFLRCCKRESFQKEVMEQRKLLNIPGQGFESAEKFLIQQLLTAKLVDVNQKYKNLNKGAAEICEKLGLPMYLNNLVEAYMVLGDGFREYTYNSFWSTEAGCQIDSLGALRIVKIYPGASRPRVLKFINKNWEILAGGPTFKQRNQPKSKQLRKRPREERDEKIYKYYKAGLVRYDGRPNIKNIQELVKKPNDRFVGLKDVDPFFASMRTDTIRNIIKIQRKRQR